MVKHFYKHYNCTAIIYLSLKFSVTVLLFYVNYSPLVAESKFIMDTQVTAAKLYTLKLCYLSTLLWQLYKMQTKPQAVYSNYSTLQV